VDQDTCMALYTISDSMANLQYIGKMLHRENHGLCDSRVLYMTGAGRKIPTRRKPLETLFHCLELPLNHRRKIPANELHSFSLPQPPAFPFSFPYLLFSLCTLGNDDLHLATAVRHQYALNSTLVSFSSFY